jgi:hypothetical protein
VTRALLAAAVAALILVGAYVALGGGRYDVGTPPDPCEARADEGRGGVDGTVERVALTSLNGTACELGVSRERLLLVLAGEIDPPPELEDAERRADAFRTGLRQAVDEEQDAGRLGGPQAFVLRQAIEVAPVDALLDQLFE